MYKKVSRRTTALLPQLKKRFPNIEDDIILSVAATNNNCSIKTTEALAEISCISVDEAMKQGLLKKRKKDVKIDRRGVPWSKIVIEQPPHRVQSNHDTDMLSEEEFQKWLQEQLDQLESEKKQKDQQNSSLSTSSTASTEDESCEDGDKVEPTKGTESDDLPNIPEGEAVAAHPEVEIKQPEILEQLPEVEMKEIISDNLAVNENIPDVASVVSPAIDSSLIILTDTDSKNDYVPLSESDNISTAIEPFVEILPEEEEKEVDQISVKLVFGKAMYRFRVPRNGYSFEALKQVANKKLEEGYEKGIDIVKGIKYTDDEGDWVTVTGQEEWEEALRVYAGDNVIKVHVL